MSTEENEVVVLRHFKDVLEQGHVELIDSYYAPDGSIPNTDTPEKWRESVLWHRKFCPGFKVTILDLMTEGDKVIGHVQIDLTYSVPADPPPSLFYIPLGKPVSWRNVGIFRIVNGKMVSVEYVSGMTDMKVAIGVIPLKQIESNRGAVRKFVDGLNQQNTALLNEVCTPEVAKSWMESLPGMYASMKGHHIELVDMVADGEGVAVKMATSGYHTGVMHGLPPSGKWWTNRVFTFFRFTDGKISEVDPLPDAENIIKQIGGSIQPEAA